jgi:hypothetical protein
MYHHESDGDASKKIAIIVTKVPSAAPDPIAVAELSGLIFAGGLLGGCMRVSALLEHGERGGAAAGCAVQHTRLSRLGVARMPYPRMNPITGPIAGAIVKSGIK